MLRLSLFLALSVSLHLMAGSFLLRPDTRATDALRSSAATQSPAVVQVLLEPLAAQPSRKPVALSAPRKPVPLATAKPAVQSVAKASAPKIVSQPASQPAVLPSATVSAVATAQPSVAAPVDVFSRQPAFRLPPQQPRYPAQARRRNQQGVVLLEVRLDERGKQREISLLRSSGFPSLDQAALDAVAQWRFHPETLDGKGVPSRVQIPIEFALLASR